MDNDDVEMVRELTPTTEEEIGRRLREINLTVQPLLKNKRRGWFYDRKIILHSLYGRIYKEVIGVDWNIVVENINALNESHKQLLIIKTQNEEQGITFKLIDGLYISELEPDRCTQANEIATEMRKVLKWFSASNLRVRLVKIADVSYYVYMGEKDEDNGNTNDIITSK